MVMVGCVPNERVPSENFRLSLPIGHVIAHGAGRSFAIDSRVVAIRRSYDDPALFGVGTALLLNPDTSDGSLVDTEQSDNRANLALAPVPDELFGSGFDG